VDPVPETIWPRRGLARSVLRQLDEGRPRSLYEGDRAVLRRTCRKLSICGKPHLLQKQPERALASIGDKVPTEPHSLGWRAWRGARMEALEGGACRGYCRVGSRRGAHGTTTHCSLRVPRSVSEDLEEMGGLGSGRWKRPGRKTVESCRVLDVNYLSAQGCLQPGWAGQWIPGLVGHVVSRPQRRHGNGGRARSTLKAQPHGSDPVLAVGIQDHCPGTGSCVPLFF
jgi:hypothetical protein